MSLTEEDFANLQIQFIEAKNGKIEAEKANGKLNSEIFQLKDYVAAMEKDQKKLESLLNKTRNTNTAGLMQENENLKMLIESSREDSKIQIRAMKENLAHQFETNQQLEKELEKYRVGVDESGLSRVPELEAKNIELQNRIQTLEKINESQEVELIAHKSVYKKDEDGDDEVDDNNNTQLLENKNKDDKETTVETVNNEVAELKIELLTWKEKYSRLEESNSALESDSEKQISDYKEKLSSLKDLKNSLDKQLKDMDSKLQIQSENRRKSIDAGKLQISALNEKLLEAGKEAEERSIQLSKMKATEMQQMELLKKSKTELDMVVDKYQQLVIENQEIKRVAENRKELVEELSKAKNELRNEHLESLEKQNQEKEKETEDMEKEYNNHLSELEKVISEKDKKFQALRAESKNVVKEKKALSRELASVIIEKESCEAKLSEVCHLVETYESLLILTYESSSELSYEFETKRKELQTQYNAEKKKTEELEVKLHDAIEAERLAEKKGTALIRDLKREVRQNRHKLQKQHEEINEAKGIIMQHEHEIPSRISTDSNLSDISNPMKITMRQESELSISSLQRPKHFQDDAQVLQLQEDNKQLISSVSTLQCELVTLKEKIAFLEENSRDLAKQNADRKEVIQKYVLSKPAMKTSKPNNPIHPSASLTMNSFMDQLSTLKDSFKISPQQEYNDKLQEMLEETLMKNMKLQENMKLIVEENTALKKRKKSDMKKSTT